MSRGHSKVGTRAGAFDAVKKRLEKGRRPKDVPQELPLGAIKLWPGLFQHRGERGPEGEAHVRSLTVAIGRSPTRQLEAVTVWWDGREWACIDGHHRLDAYKAAKVGADHAVPVSVFDGSIGEAMGEAAIRNTRDKLPMSSAEKSNAAWHLVAATELSKAQIAAAAGVSDATVASMRRTLVVLRAKEDTADVLDGAQVVELRNLTWLEAKRLAENRDAPDFDQDDWKTKRAEAMALSISKALGREASKYPEVLADALDLYDPRLRSRLVEYWQEDTEDIA